jgi:hypothetical protein
MMPWCLLCCLQPGFGLEDLTIACFSAALAESSFRQEEWNTCSTFGFMLLVMEKQGTFVALVWIYAL